MATITGTPNDDKLFIAAGVSGDTLLGLAGNDDLEAGFAAGDNTVSGGDGNDKLFAFKNDKLFGDAGNDELSATGGQGGNTLSGGEGNDTIFASFNDSVFGDAGDDTIFGGQGGNTIAGGSGKDIFWIAKVDVPNNPNTINDFNQLQDTIRVDLAGVTKLSDLAIAQSGNDTTISFGGKTLAILKNTGAASLSENNVVVDPNSQATNVGSNVTSYDFKNLPKIGTTSKGQDLFLGGFSGLSFQGTNAKNGNLKFITLTDRGPNGEPTGQNRPFLLPEFQPRIISFELNQSTGEITITKETGLFRADGTTKLTGLPNLQAGANGIAYTDEIGVNLDGGVLPNDVFGIDSEGVVLDRNGNYWVVDEYRPAIYQFDTNGKLLDRFIPKGTATAAATLTGGSDTNSSVGTFGTEVLPEVYAQRRSNRGFEAVALEGNKLYAFIQSAIDNPDNAGDTTSRNSRNLRILEFDIKTKTVTGEYLYLLDDISGSGNAKTDKIGDAVSLGNGKFAVVERDDLSTTASNKLIYQIDLASATNINNSANFTLPSGKTIEQLTPDELTAANIKPVSKNLIANAAKSGYTGVEKLEGLALIDNNTLALINDNDFNVAVGSAVPSKLGILELSNNLPTTLKFQKNDTDVFDISGGSKPKPTLSFTIKGKSANQVSEIGVFIVDDAFGNIDGTAPNQSGYAEKALGRAKVIVSAIANSPNGFSLDGLQRLLGFNNNDKLRFYAINDKSTTTDLILKTKSFEKVTFSTTSILNFQEIGTAETTIKFNNLEINIKATDDDLLLGTGLQDRREGEVLDLRSVDTTLFSQVKADFTLNREAAFNNFVGFYKIENEKGDIKKADGSIVSVGQSGYTQAAISNRVAGIDLSVGDQAIATSSGIFAAGSIFAPFIIINNRPDAILDNNPNNDPAVYFSYLGANSDGIDHVRLLGNNTFGFEDLPSGGDFDYNDFIVKVNLTPVK
ncbi:esterase-like activity of phytase family protein [Pseudanabaena sp. FACHB-1998]|uniref:esterase-like activity of phytase family protein n=1 Tax=Pseudanabaena sp. FACHB-1998 TaxID=2692858 RepID=UPI001680B1E3|nr:esterase-like activity of phytase family protein [Pseudanabaena sp. FACHB-1998]MBD2177762.1 esterase-like activity of phytase family protein [Pseudanabaena sp. FACHB-1998]